MKTKRFIKLLFLIFLAGLFVAILGCSPEEETPQCTTTIEDVEIKDIEIDLNTFTPETLSIPVDVYIFTNDTTRYTYPEKGIKTAFINANKAFSGVFALRPNTIQSLYSKHSLEDVYYNQLIRDSISNNEMGDSTLNLVIFKAKGDGLLGFAIQDNNSVFSGYNILDKRSSTLAHETGHVLGLAHTFALKENEPKMFKELGLDYSDIAFNIMSYSCFQDHFTIEQLAYMLEYLRDFKSELIE